MDAIINDFSLNGQYETPEEFFDSLVKYTLPAFQSLVRQGCNILKSYTTYARKISKDVTLHDVLRMPQFRGYPEATRLKTFLVSCSEPPYWSDDSQTDCTQEYSVAQLSAEDMSLPNCITEAVTRNTAILSFFDPNFMDLKIPVYKNSQKYELQNLYNNESAGQALFLNGLIGLSELLMSGSYQKPVIFGGTRGKYYADQGFIEGKLTIEDGLLILSDFRMSIEFISKGQLKSRFSDSVKHKKTTYYEFRCTLLDKREFRIYYFLDDKGNLVYLNSLVKKTSQIPKGVKDKSVELIKSYKETNQT